MEYNFKYLINSTNFVACEIRIPVIQTAYTISERYMKLKFLLFFFIICSFARAETPVVQWEIT